MNVEEKNNFFEKQFYNLYDELLKIIHTDYEEYYSVLFAEIVKNNALLEVLYNIGDLVMCNWDEVLELPLEQLCDVLNCIKLGHSIKVISCDALVYYEEFQKLEEKTIGI